jgi:hypothetical protein
VLGLSILLGIVTHTRRLWSGGQSPVLEA